MNETVLMLTENADSC